MLSIMNAQLYYGRVKEAISHIEMNEYDCVQVNLHLWTMNFTQFSHILLHICFHDCLKMGAGEITYGVTCMQSQLLGRLRQEVHELEAVS
jgi:hypothetical protein